MLQVYIRKELFLLHQCGTEHIYYYIQRRNQDARTLDWARLEHCLECLEKEHQMCNDQPDASKQYYSVILNEVYFLPVTWTW